MLVVNTCAFIDRAKQESIDTILEMAELKKTGACQRLVVTGCLAERYRDELREQIPEIDAVLGTGEVPGDRRGHRRHAGAPWDSPAALLRGDSPRSTVARGTVYRRPGHQPLGSRTELPTYLYDADTPRMLATPRHYAYVKVAEGCDYKCAFCIIPRLRGHYRSRAGRRRSCAKRGRWPHAASRNCCSSARTRRSTATISASVARWPAAARLNAVDGLEWIRLLYLYPTTIDDDDARGDGRVREGLQVHRPAAAARVGCGAEAHAAARARGEPTSGCSIASARASPASRSGPPSSSASRARPTATSTSSTAFVAAGRLRPRRRLHLLARGGHAPPANCDDDVPAAVEAEAARPPDGAAAEIVAAAQQARVGQRVRLVVDGPSPSTSWSSAAGWRRRRPTSTRWSTSPNATRRPSRRPVPGRRNRRRARTTTCWSSGLPR